MYASLWIVVAVLVFGIVHSVLASRKLKDELRKRLGRRLVDGWYRFLYNVIAVITLLPAVYLASFYLSDNVVYSVAPPWSYCMIAIQLVGLVGLIFAVSQTGAWHFMGVMQIVAYLSGKPNPDKDAQQLVVSGLYKYVRHPLYFFSFLLIWFSPAQTVNSLVLAAAFTAYFVIGSLFEEKRLLKAFGEDYARYQRTTPWLLPIPLSLRKSS